MASTFAFIIASVAMLATTASGQSGNTLVVSSPYTSSVTCVSDAGVTGPIDAQLNKPIQNGMFTFYGVSSAYAACGLPSNNPNMSACVSGQLFTSGAKWTQSCFPDKHYMLKDSVCLNKCVKIDYKGKSLTVPINNRCQDFQPSHVDLSEAGFVWLTGNAKQGVGQGATITYIKCTDAASQPQMGSATTTAAAPPNPGPPAPATTTTTPTPAPNAQSPSSSANTLVVSSPYTSDVTCLSDAGVTGPIDAQLNQPIQNGMFTFYGVSSDYAACGLPTNNPNMSACVSGQLFTSGAQWTQSCFPDKHYMLKDSVCLNKCVKIDYKGKSLTVPINNRCQDFQPSHVDLSEAGFVWLTGNAKQGVGQGATITYIKCT